MDAVTKGRARGVRTHPHADGIDRIGVRMLSFIQCLADARPAFHRSSRL